MRGNFPNFRRRRIRQTKTNKQERAVSIAKNSEITSSSNESFEDAIESGIRRFAKTVDKVQGAWIKEQKVLVSGDKVSEYRVTMVVTFVIKD
jgi:flavin-binding protein dodecin